MTGKITTLLLVVTCANAVIVWDDLRVTYIQNGYENDTGYIQLPRLQRDAVAQGWTKPPELKGHPYDILCPNRDPTICVIYNKVSGKANGLHVGILRNSTNSPYYVTRHPTFVPCTRFGYEVYAVSIYTAKRAGGAHGQTNEGLWMEVGPKGTPWTQVPRQASGMAKAGYTKQGCIPAMGTHYYYKMTRNLNCNDFEPVFALMKAGEMVGFGIKIFGTPSPLSRNWLETFPEEGLKSAVPESPQCMADWTRQHGLISLHVWLVKQPWTLTCP